MDVHGRERSRAHGKARVMLRRQPGALGMLGCAPDLYCFHRLVSKRPLVRRLGLASNGCVACACDESKLSRQAKRRRKGVVVEWASRHEKIGDDTDDTSGMEKEAMYPWAKGMERIVKVEECRCPCR